MAVVKDSGGRKRVRGLIHRPHPPYWLVALKYFKAWGEVLVPSRAGFLLRTEMKQYVSEVAAAM